MKTRISLQTLDSKNLQNYYKNSPRSPQTNKQCQQPSQSQQQQQLQHQQQPPVSKITSYLSNFNKQTSSSSTRNSVDFQQMKQATNKDSPYKGHQSLSKINTMLKGTLNVGKKPVADFQSYFNENKNQSAENQNPKFNEKEEYYPQKLGSVQSARQLKPQIDQKLDQPQQINEQGQSKVGSRGIDGGGQGGGGCGSNNSGSFAAATYNNKTSQQNNFIKQINNYSLSHKNSTIGTTNQQSKAFSEIYNQLMEAKKPTLQLQSTCQVQQGDVKANQQIQGIQGSDQQNPSIIVQSQLHHQNVDIKKKHNQNYSQQVPPHIHQQQQQHPLATQSGNQRQQNSANTKNLGPNNKFLSKKQSNEIGLEPKLSLQIHDYSADLDQGVNSQQLFLLQKSQTTTNKSLSIKQHQNLFQKNESDQHNLLINIYNDDQHQNNNINENEVNSQQLSLSKSMQFQPFSLGQAQQPQQQSITSAQQQLQKVNNKNQQKIKQLDEQNAQQQDLLNYQRFSTQPSSTTNKSTSSKSGFNFKDLIAKKFEHNERCASNFESSTAHTSNLEAIACYSNSNFNNITNNAFINNSNLAAQSNKNDKPMQEQNSGISLYQSSMAQIYFRVQAVLQKSKMKEKTLITEKSQLMKELQCIRDQLEEEQHKNMQLKRILQENNIKYTNQQ